MVSRRGGRARATDGLPELYTLHPTTYTLLPAPCTLNPKSYTLQPKHPHTLNPEP